MSAQTRSCSVVVTNQLAETITLVGWSGTNPADRGIWQVQMPTSIAPGASGTGLLVPTDDSSGTYGWVTYCRASDPTHPITFTFQCPKTHSNEAGYSTQSAGLAIPFTTVVDGISYVNSCPSQGRPLTVNYTIGYRIQSLIAISGAYPLIDTDGVTMVPTVMYSAPSVSSSGTVTPAVQNPAMFITPAQTSVFAMVIMNDVLTQGGYSVMAKASQDAQINYTSEPVPASANHVTSVDLVFTPQLQFDGVAFNVNDILNVSLLDAKENSLAEAACAVEIYYPLASPANCWPTGVWVLFLRALFGASGVTWPATAAQACQNVVTLCYNGFNGQYKYTYYALHNYGDSGNFALADLLSNSYTQLCSRLGPTLDCVDQANFVACALSALGIECYMYQTIDCQFIAQDSPLGLVQGQYPFYTQQTKTPMPGPGSCVNFWWPVNPLNPPPAFQGHNIGGVQIEGELYFLDACLGPYSGPAQGYLDLFSAPQPSFYPSPTAENLIKFVTLCTPRPPWSASSGASLEP
ncbi:hypothetical protein [Roseateles sp. LYH14W]|uniref:Uncharacterized protein n=1 Tax=Pelomonas parva TaxID=3299032 RepID=A0ABW7F1X6_9BURK